MVEHLGIAEVECQKRDQYRILYRYSWIFFLIIQRNLPNLRLSLVGQPRPVGAPVGAPVASPSGVTAGGRGGRHSNELLISVQGCAGGLIRGGTCFGTWIPFNRLESGRITTGGWGGRGSWRLRTLIPKLWAHYGILFILWDHMEPCPFPDKHVRK